MAYEKNKPASSTSLRASNPIILSNQVAIELALNREHTFSTGGTEATQAQHRQGSARCFFQDSEPTTQVDGGAFASTDLGSLWFKTNSSPVNKYSVLTATTPTWTPVSDEIIAVLLAANRVFAGTLGVTGDFTVNSNFDVTASNGNTLVGGTFDIQGTIAVVGVLDEDDLTSDSATNLATQQSIKAYIDGLVAAALPGNVKAFCTVNAAGALQSGSFNVSGAAKDSTGNYTITWDTDFGNTNYVVAGNVFGTTTGVFTLNSKATGSCTIRMKEINSTADKDLAFNLMAIGTQ